MKSVFPQVAALFLLCFLSSCSVDSIENETDGLSISNTEHSNVKVVVSYTSIEKEIQERINQFRSNLGLSVLVLQDVITEKADEHSDTMIKDGAASHKNFGARATYIKNTLGADDVAENVGANYNSAQGVVTAWINSDSHRTVLEDDFTHIGISAKKDTNGKYYYTTIFSKL
ncbi:CAP domain-containing protein [Spongiivirga citrea]|uniref:CAP domain-containing protein n=1 Tax=Spongiivirga citrea TaxID=1481457 RepID=A0A6M0CV47_9FLAO|nr:CAP domain-containing protein [Spongiivirga citrea]NER17660.1 CAP domain-containing protein [Spongiivirga citrea]